MRKKEKSKLLRPRFALAWKGLRPLGYPFNFVYKPVYGVEFVVFGVVEKEWCECEFRPSGRVFWRVFADLLVLKYKDF
jgi:hypothetical protein